MAFARDGFLHGHFLLVAFGFASRKKCSHDEEKKSQHRKKLSLMRRRRRRRWRRRRRLRRRWRRPKSQTKSVNLGDLMSETFRGSKYWSLMRRTDPTNTCITCNFVITSASDQQ